MLLQVQNLESRLASMSESITQSERRADDLIRAGQRAASKEQKEAAELREKVETYSRMALHWQEQAALANEALRQAESTVEQLRQQGSNNAASGEMEPTNLSSELAAVKKDHARQLQELEARHRAELAAATAAQPSAAVVAAVRAEAAATVAAMQEEHNALLECLLEERARLDAALRCIKDMTGMVSGAEGSDAEEDRAGEDGCAEEHLAVGIPVEGTPMPLPLDHPGVLAGTSFTLRSHRPDSAATVAPAGDDAGSSRQQLFFGGAAGWGGGADTSLQRSHESASAVSLDGDEHGVYSFAAAPADGGATDEEYGSPAASLASGSEFGYRGRRSAQSNHSVDDTHRVAAAGGNCFVVDYRGERPDAVTEASMNRILDRPTDSAGGGAPREDAAVYVLPSVLEERKDSNEEVTPPAMNRSRRMCPASISAPTSCAKSERLGEADGAVPWAAGSLSLPGSRCASPEDGPRAASVQGRLPAGLQRAGLLDDDENGSVELRCNPIAMSDAVAAMDTGSPAAANFMAQYMADHLTVRASMPVMSSAKGRQAGAGASSKIGAVRRSAPAGKPKRSSFLDRPPLPEGAVYDGRACKYLC